MMPQTNMTEWFLSSPGCSEELKILQRHKCVLWLSSIRIKTSRSFVLQKKSYEIFLLSMSFTQVNRTPTHVSAFQSVFFSKKKNNKAVLVTDLESPALLKFPVY